MFFIDFGNYFEMTIKINCKFTRLTTYNYHVRLLDILQYRITTCARHQCLRPCLVSLGTNCSIRIQIVETHFNPCLAFYTWPYRSAFFIGLQHPNHQGQHCRISYPDYHSGHSIVQHYPPGKIG